MYFYVDLNKVCSFMTCCVFNFLCIYKYIIDIRPLMMAFPSTKGTKDRTLLNSTLSSPTKKLNYSSILFVKKNIVF